MEIILNTKDNGRGSEFEKYITFGNTEVLAFVHRQEF
jgi:hypothetical protein